MGAIRRGTRGMRPPYFFRQWGYNMLSPPHFFRFSNMLVSHQTVPLTFCNKIAFMLYLLLLLYALALHSLALTSRCV